MCGVSSLTVGIDDERKDWHSVEEELDRLVRINLTIKNRGGLD